METTLEGVEGEGVKGNKFGAHCVLNKCFVAGHYFFSLQIIQKRLCLSGSGSIFPITGFPYRLRGNVHRISEAVGTIRGHGTEVGSSAQHG